MDAAGPQFKRERMVVSVWARELAQDRNSDAELFGLWRDAETTLPGNVGRVFKRAKMSDEFGRGLSSETRWGICRLFCHF
jgi:hypothetical protein